jgi:hypothetical protein
MLRLPLKRVNVPSFAISSAASRNAPSATFASAPPMLIRDTVYETPLEDAIAETIRRLARLSE